MSNFRMLHRTAEELARPWLTASESFGVYRGINVFIDSDDDAIVVRVYESEAPGKTIWAKYHLDAAFYARWERDARSCIAQLNNAVASVIGMIDTQKGKVDPRVKRLKWHASRRAR